MNAKTVILGLVLAFVLFYIITSPANAATMVQASWQWCTDVAHGIGNFLNQFT